MQAFESTMSQIQMMLKMKEVRSTKINFAKSSFMNEKKKKKKT